MKNVNMTSKINCDAKCPQHLAHETSTCSVQLYIFAALLVGYVVLRKVQ